MIKAIASLFLACVVSGANADSSNPTYYAQWGGGGQTNVCTHYTTPSQINPWYQGSIEFPTRVDGAIGTPNYSLPIICGGDGAAGQNASYFSGSRGGYAGYQPLPIVATLSNQRDNVNDQLVQSKPPIIQNALVFISMGGWGGGGGDGYDGYSASTGGTGAKGGDLTLTFNPGAYSSIDTSVNNTAGYMTSIFAQSVGGNGGNGGSGGGNGGVAGVGGSVILTNSVNLTTYGNGVFAQSLGGWGGTGTNANGSWWTILW